MTLTVSPNRELLLATLRGLEPQLRGRGVVGIAIFGSRARGDARENSDLDVLLDIHPATKFSLFDLLGVQHLIQDEIGIETQATLRSDLDLRMSERIADDLIKVF